MAACLRGKKCIVIHKCSMKIRTEKLEPVLYFGTSLLHIDRNKQTESSRSHRDNQVSKGTVDTIF